MLAIHPEYLVDENGERKAVVVPLPEWEKIVEQLEELDDIQTYDEAKAGNQDAVPFEQAVRDIEGGYDA